MAAFKNKKKNNGIFAAVGAATGLGNAFRFPALCSKYGAAFIIAYAAALALVCFPLLCAELHFGRVKTVGKAAKVWAAIVRAASVNSALIALYYGVIAAKLGSQSFNYIVYANGSGYKYSASALFVLALVAVLGGAYVLLKGGSRALSKSGKASVFASLALFIPLAIAGAVRGGVFSRMDFTLLAGGSIWADALGQALLSLSLAAGVMPAFARTQNTHFSPVKNAFKIIAANFAGCMLATLSTLPFISFIPQTVGVNCGIHVYNQVISAVSHGKFGMRVMGFAVFTALTVVAVHSLASLAYPAVSAIANRIKCIPLVFCALAVLFAPLFLLNGLEVLSACDQMACSVTAVLIALAECVFFASQRHIKGVIGFFVRYLCPVTCLALALFSLCSARFSVFSPLSVACAYACLAAVALSSALPYLIFAVRVRTAAA